MACMRRLACSKFKGNSDRGLFNSNKILLGISSNLLRNYANEGAVQEDSIPDYPPIKPHYPPGVWGDIAGHSAWKTHKWAHDQLSITRVKERLESVAGEKARVMWLVEAMDKRPNNLEFKQYITKTHIVNGLPAGAYSGIDVENAYSKVKSMIPDLILQEREYLHKKQLEEDVEHRGCDESRYIAHHLLGSVTRTLMAALVPFCDHFVRSQLDEDVRVETFWHVGGFTGKERRAKGKRMGFMTKDGKCLGVLQFQYKHKADWQIRSEMPLPEFISQDNPVCREGFVPTADYVPTAAGFKYIYDRPISVSGHWIGDPCEYGLISLHTVPTWTLNKMQEAGEKYLRMAEISFGLAAGFGSCRAQAYNQGFSDFLELTHPLTTQCVLTNGQELRFFAYQLNTMQLWNSAKPMRNILWASEPVKMFDAIENGQVKGLNEEAFKTLMSLIMLQPVDRGIDLRPYLPDEESPVKKSIYINLKGEEPLPVKKIGRWEYPRKAVYF